MLLRLGVLCLATCLLFAVSFAKIVSPSGVLCRTTNVHPVCRLAGNSEIQPGEVLVAWGKYEDSIEQIGWSFLSIHTNGSVDDKTQAYAAGFYEGAVSYQRIYQHYLNLIRPFNVTANLRQYLADNEKWLQQQLNENQDKDPYWYELALIRQQLAGVVDGYNSHCASGTNLTAFELLLLNTYFELNELSLYNASEAVFKKFRQPSRCSVLMKPTPDFSDVLISHATWSGYSLMLRVFKLYDFSFSHISKAIPRTKEMFSSYPGQLYSGDDLYLLGGSHMLSVETTNAVFNLDLYRNFLKPQTVFEWMRNVVSNRLATSGEQWTEIFSQFNSGTYNNQWMIFDFKQFVPGQRQLSPNTLWYIEQIPGYTVRSDITEVLQEQGYWASFNRPYSSFIYNMSGWVGMAQKYGDWFTHDHSPRAQIFHRDQPKVTNLESLKRIMRYNDYRNDPISRCNCTPPYSASNSIAARSDLNPVNGIYPFPDLAHDGSGATDAKVTSYLMFQKFAFVAISGPTYDQQPVFKWSTSNLSDPHNGHPDAWHFPWVPVQLN